MKVLYITSVDGMGQQFNGHLLQNELKKYGHSSDMVVRRKLLNESNIHQVGSKFTRFIDKYLATLDTYLSMYSVLPASAYTLYSAPYYHQADIIHLQLPHGLAFYSLFNVPLMNRQHPMIWTMHDPWLMSGHCVYSLDCERWTSGCGKCPDLNLPFAIKRDTSASMWKFKHWIMHHSNVHLVVASQWMQARVERSPILSHLPCTRIPFGINRQVFYPHDREECRARLGIPPEAHVLAFRSTPLRFSYKGTPFIEEALRIFKPDRPTYLITFDEKGGLDSIRDKYHFLEMGWVSDQEKLAQIFSATDIFLSPSIAEAFGVMPVEAMACGTPSIVFEGTSLPEIVHTPHAGIAVPYKNSTALAEAVRMLLNDYQLYQSLVENGLKIVKQEYTLDGYIEKHVHLYESLVN